MSDETPHEFITVKVGPLLVSDALLRDSALDPEVYVRQALERRAKRHGLIVAPDARLERTDLGTHGPTGLEQPWRWSYTIAALVCVTDGCPDRSSVDASSERPS